MQYRRLGNSQLKVSTLCLGTMMFADQTDAKVAGEIVAHAREHGVNFIDTADVYSTGESEKVVGALLKGQRHDWILAVDSDERVSDPLRQEIEGLRGRGFDRPGYYVPRVSHYLGRWIRATDWYPDFQLRLFDRRHGQWQGGLVHESVRVQGAAGRLRHELQHYSYRSAGEHLGRIHEYARLWAEQAYAEGRRSSLLSAFGAGAWAFFRNYVLKRGLLLGSTGLTVSTLNAHYSFAKLLLLHERARQSPSGPPA